MFWGGLPHRNMKSKKIWTLQSWLTLTLAPQAMAHSAIPSWSVDTQTESNFPNSSIVWRDQLIRGLDPRGTRFFKGIPLLPPLARTRPSSKIQYNYSLVRLILVFTNGCKM